MTFSPELGDTFRALALSSLIGVKVQNFNIYFTSLHLLFFHLIMVSAQIAKTHTGSMKLICLNKQALPLVFHNCLECKFVNLDFI